LKINPTAGRFSPFVSPYPNRRSSWKRQHDPVARAPCREGLTHRYILREAWGTNAENQNHYLRVYIARLREKLKTRSSHPDILLTEPGVGYRLIETA
jgi:hypothetical protein